MSAAETLPDLFAATVQRHGDRLGVVDGELRWTWQEVARRVERRRTDLVARGVKPGTSVALVLPNSAEFVVDFLAVTSIGATAIPLNTQFTLDELGRYVEGCAVRGVIALGERASDAAELAAGQLEPAWWAASSGDGDWIDEGGSGAVEGATRIDPSPDTRALIGFSSGSTGTPKQIPRTHANLVAECEQFTATAGITAADVILAVVPLFHAHGLGNCLLASVRSGSTLVLLEEFARGATIDALQRAHVTVLPAVPFMLGVLADGKQIERADLTSLRLCFTAGAAAPKHLFERFLDASGIAPRQLYGCSEAGSVTFNLDDDAMGTAESVGRPLQDVALDVVDKSGCSNPRGQTGEIAFRSRALTAGYLGHAEANRRSFRDGWFFSGDIGYVDDEGRLYITGRTKVFISTGGHKVDPIEVEKAIGTHPRVKEVVVVGVPQARGGETVKAVVVADGAVARTDIITICRARLAEFKVPGIVEFRDEIPRSPLGKILRKYLIDEQGEA